MGKFFRFFNGISNEMIFNRMSLFEARVIWMKKMSSEETLRTEGKRNSQSRNIVSAKMQNESYTVNQQPRCKASERKQRNL